MEKTNYSLFHLDSCQALWKKTNGEKCQKVHLYKAPKHKKGKDSLK